MDKKKIAGVVLAGGQSSRMGENKAFLDYNGRPLLDHMIDLLKQTRVDDVYVSGSYTGYKCIADSEPHKGPACAIADVLSNLLNYDGVMFLPVDMPVLDVEVLRLLMGQERSSYIENSPLPAFVAHPYPEERFRSVKDFMKAINACSVMLPLELKKSMKNTNTPEEWLEATR